MKKGGLGSAVVEYFAQLRSANPDMTIPPVAILGLPDSFVTHGPVPRLHQDCGIDQSAIVAAARG